MMRQASSKRSIGTNRTWSVKYEDNIEQAATRASFSLLNHIGELTMTSLN